MEQDLPGTQTRRVPSESEPVALYVRVSSADQNYQLQLRELSDYAAGWHWRVVGVYEDVMNGARTSRPGLNRLMADAAARRFHCVLVWSQILKA